MTPGDGADHEPEATRPRSLGNPAPILAKPSQSGPPALKAVLVQSGLYALPLLLASFGVVTLLQRADRAGTEERLRSRLRHSVEVRSRLIEASFVQTSSDLIYLAQQSSTRRWATDESSLRDVQQDLVVFARSQPRYAQVRYAQVRLLNAEGKEVVRVESYGDQPQLSPPGDLQDKSDRPYVAATLALPPRGVYVSRFDLNVERGQVQRPIEPAIRFASPVYDDAGEAQGLVILNYHGRRLLDRLRAASATVPGGSWLTNDQGQWLVGPRAEDEWTFMFRDRPQRTLADEHPQAWARIRGGQPRGEFALSDGAFTFAAIAVGPHLVNSGATQVDAVESWILVGHQAPTLVAAVSGPSQRRWELVFLGSCVLIVLTSWLSGRQTVRRRQAEGAVRARERYFRGLLLAAPDAVVVCDADGLVLVFNEAAERLFGYEAHEVVGQPVELLVPGPFRAAHPAARAEFLKAPHVRPMSERPDLAARRKDGTEFPVAITLGPVSTDRGYFVFAAVRDVTERRRVRQEIQALNARLQGTNAELAQRARELQAANDEARAQKRELDSFFGLSLDLLCISGFDGQFQLVNPAWESTLGYTAAQLGSEPFLSFVHPDDHDVTVAVFAQVRSGGRVDRFENRYRHSDGSYRWLSWSAVGLEEARVVYAAARDVTERRRAEKLLREQTEELQAQAAELKSQGDELRVQQRLLEEKNLELERASRLKSEFLANMSHELRTPLNAVIGFSELLIDEGRTTFEARQLKQLDAIYQSGRHLLELINDILDLVKIEAGRMTLSLEPISVCSAIGEALALVRPAAQRKDIELTEAVQVECTALADRAKLRQILLNLLSNALKFSPEGTEVEAGAEEAGEFVRFWVRDHGEGIPESLLPDLFEPFVQGESPLVKRHHGTGLGLAISKQLVEQHQGRLQVQTAPGEGATFSFTIPLRQGPPAAPQGADAPATGAHLPTTQSLALEPERPVLIERHRAPRELPRTSLLEAGCEAAEAATSAEALPLMTAADLGDAERGKGNLSREALVAAVNRATLLAPAVEARNTGPLILVVDDHDLNRELVAGILGQRGYRVVGAASGAAGVEAARRELPALILMDLAMPGKDGFEARRELGADPSTEGIPVMALTALAMESDEERVRQEGFAGYLTKPIDRRALEAAVERLLADQSDAG